MYPFRKLILPLAVIVVGLNLRPVLAVVGPSLDAIQRQTGLSDTGASLLTTLPIAIMGLCLLATNAIRSALGDRLGVALGLGFIAVACGLRAWGGGAQLLVSSIIAGAGIAVAQALMPAIIRNCSPARSAGLMALYSTGIMGGAAIAGFGGPWIEKSAGLSVALACWGGPALAALAVWRLSAWSLPWVSPQNAPPISLKKTPRAWLLVSVFALGTGAYTLVLAWLPPFYTQLGWSPQAAGAMLGLVTLSEVAAGASVSFWIDRAPDRRPMILGAICALFGGMVLLASAPLSLAYLAVGLAGAGIGALFPLLLIVALDHGETAREASAIAGFVQGGGYLLSAFFPLIAGIIRQISTDLTTAWWTMAGLCLVLVVLALRLRPNDRVMFDQ